MVSRSTEFLTLARIASWLDFPAGVLETDPKARVFTIVIKTPAGILSQRVARSEMEGVWPPIILEPGEVIPSVLEQEQIHRRLIRGRLQKVIHTT